MTKKWSSAEFFICGHPRTSLAAGIQDPLHDTGYRQTVLAENLRSIDWWTFKL